MLIIFERFKMVLSHCIVLSNIKDCSYIALLTKYSNRSIIAIAGQMFLLMMLRNTNGISRITIELGLQYTK